MTNLARDIDVIRDVLIAFEEGASDERYAARQSLRKLLQDKVQEWQTYESEIEKAFLQIQDSVGEGQAS